ncbi:MAG: 2-dehydropantoate 2-reductase [Chloroflexi bacterium]|nr:2-dehydropantoate 2-reductase [Chloroflexota bacterium]
METIYILGSGTIGFALAANLAHAGREVIAARTSRDDIPKTTIPVVVGMAENQIKASIETISLSKLSHLEGILVITAKSYANESIAAQLRGKTADSPIILLQNGVGVEKPFLNAGFSQVYRCVLYATSQAASENEFRFRPITASPIGIIHGDEAGLNHCVSALHTDRFPFRAEADIQREVWKKAIINAVFNSICPLLEVDNGIFVRDEQVRELAIDVVQECVMLVEKLKIDLTQAEIMEQLLVISKRSDGQLISTLQDIQAGRQTEIDSLNLEIARIAASMQVEVPKTELLGKMILAKSQKTIRPIHE